MFLTSIIAVVINFKVVSKAIKDMYEVGIDTEQAAERKGRHLFVNSVVEAADVNLTCPHHYFSS